MDKIVVTRNAYSTSTPLAGAAVATSTAIKMPRGLSRIVVAAFADQTGNLFVEQSRDGATWRAPAAQAVAANALISVEHTVTMPYVRVRYVNGATPQTAFDLFATLLT